MTKNRERNKRKEHHHTRLAVSVRKRSCLKALLSLQDRGGRRLKAAELDGSLFCGLVGRSKVRFGFLSLAGCLGKVVREVNTEMTTFCGNYHGAD